MTPKTQLLAESRGLPQEIIWIFIPLSPLSESFRQDFNLKVFFIIKNIFIMKNVTDFRKMVETGVDPCLKDLQATMSSKWESSLALVNIHCDQNIDKDIVVNQFAGKPADTIIILTELLTELDMRS